MTLATFLLLLLIVSTMTGLTVEGIKVLLDEQGKTYKSNMLAGIVSVGLSIIISILYCIMTATALNAVIVVYLIALVFLSWLCAMVGYDKVIQAISQFKAGE